MMRSVTIYGISDMRNKSDSRILREKARNIYKSSRRLVKESYDDEPETGVFFYDSKHLSKLEDIIFESAEALYPAITYKPQKEQLQQVMDDILCGREYHYGGIVEDVINDFAYQYFKEDEEELEANRENPEFHCEYLIRKFKKMIHVIVRVLDENELESELYI